MSINSRKTYSKISKFHASGEISEVFKYLHKILSQETFLTKRLFWLTNVYFKIICLTHK
jgi:hypothetical protein